MIKLIDGFAKKLSEQLEVVAPVGLDFFPVLHCNFSALPNSTRIEIKYKGLDLIKKGANGETDYPNFKDDLEYRLKLDVRLYSEGDFSERWLDYVMQVAQKVREVLLFRLVNFKIAGSSYAVKTKKIAENGINEDFENNNKSIFEEIFESELIYEAKLNNVKTRVNNNTM